MTWHVVCHDCTFERIRELRRSAQEVSDRHYDITAHNVEVMEIG